MLHQRLQFLSKALHKSNHSRSIVATQSFHISASRLFKSDSTETPRAHTTQIQKEPETELLHLIQQTIKASGPLSMSHYMALCLTHPTLGYYTAKDNVFGVKGDFITSPEISQMFGELVAVWIVQYMMQNYSSKPFEIIELGPGRGALMIDILRSLKQFRNVFAQLESVTMVDESPILIKTQMSKLMGYKSALKIQTMTLQQFQDLDSSENAVKDEAIHKIYISHEFFDAMPVYQFKRAKEGWREMMVDVDDSPASPFHLRHVLARDTTKASLLIHTRDLSHTKEGDIIQISPPTYDTSLIIAKRVAKYGGAHIVVDYGTETVLDDRVRGIKDHKWTSCFSQPGKVDLSSDVEFSVIQESAKNGGAACHGPMTQGNFLKSMGIGARLMALLANVKDENTKKDLIESYRRLIDPKEMGQAYQFCVVTPKDVPTPYPFNPEFPK